MPCVVSLHLSFHNLCESQRKNSPICYPLVFDLKVKRNFTGLKFNLHLSEPLSFISKAWGPAQHLKWQSDIWSDQSPIAKSKPKKSQLFFCKHHHFRFLHSSPQFWFVSNNARWRVNAPRQEAEKWGGVWKREVEVESANPLTGFRCCCRHQRPAGCVKAACCDMAYLGPRAAQELHPVEAGGWHDAAAATDGGSSTSGDP